MTATDFTNSTAIDYTDFTDYTIFIYFQVR